MRRGRRDDSGAVIQAQKDKGREWLSESRREDVCPHPLHPHQVDRTGDVAFRAEEEKQKPGEGSDLPSIQLTLVPSPAPPGPPFRPCSLCVLAQGTQGLTGKGGAGVSPGQPGTRPTPRLRLGAAWATGQGRGKVPLTNSFSSGMGRDQLPHQLSAQPRCPPWLFLAGSRVWSVWGGVTVGEGL